METKSRTMHDGDIGLVVYSQCIVSKQVHKWTLLRCCRVICYCSRMLLLTISPPVSKSEATLKMIRSRSMNHYHRQSTEPFLYTHLSKSDIQTLVNILSHAPSKSSSALTPAYKQFTRDEVDKLPTHLRCKLPFLSSSCSLHRKMAVQPLRSIFTAIQEEVDIYAPHVWVPLQARGVMSIEQCKMLTTLEQVSRLWTPSEVHRSRASTMSLGGPAVQYIPGRCTACLLAQLGSNAELVTALGVFFIGRVNPEVWKKSKRIVFLESWLRKAVYPNQADAAIQKMWQLGSELREVRKDNSTSERSYIDEHLSEARQANGRRPDVSHATRPADSNSRRSTLVEDVIPAGLSADDLFADVRGGPSGAVKQAPRRLHRHEKTPVKAPATGGMVYYHEELERLNPFFEGDDEANAPKPRPASSVYSREVDDDREVRDSFDIIGLGARCDINREIDDVLSLYRHSEVKPEEPQTWI